MHESLVPNETSRRNRTGLSEKSSSQTRGRRARRLPWLAAALLAIVGVVAGCGASGKSGELSVSGVQPCKLISSAALGKLPVSRGPFLLAGSLSGVDMKGQTCRYTVVFGDSGAERGNRVTVSTITNHGIGWQTDGHFENRSSKDVSAVRGYDTVRVWNGEQTPGKDDSCTLYIGIASDQALRINVGESVTDDDPPTCETAQRFGDAAVRGLADK